MPDNTDEKTHPLASDPRSLKPVEPVTSADLPKSVSLQLYRLMNKVVEDDVNPKTVQAACACATEIHRMLKLNLEIKRSGM